MKRWFFIWVFVLTAGLEAADSLVIDAPTGEISFPDAQLFYEKNLFHYGSDFDSGSSVTVNACGTLDFQGASRVTLSGALTNNSVLKLTDAESVTLSNVTTPGSLWVDSGTKVSLVPSSSSSADWSLSGLYGGGTLQSDGELVCVSQLLSPSYWGRSAVTFLNDDGTPGATTLPAVTSGSTLTIQGSQVTLGEDAIFAPYVFTSEAEQTRDQLTVSGTVCFEEGAYIQPMLSESLRSNPSAASDERQVILKANILNVPGNSQQYAWGDMTSEAFSGYYDRPDEICSPIVYSIHYDKTSGEISLEKEFVWCGNYMKLVQSDGDSPGATVREVASLFNEMMYQGTTRETNEEEVETLYWLSDLGILRQVAQSSDAESAALLMRQISPEIYFSQFALTTLNEVRQASTALEQMSLARQSLGLRSSLGRCTDGDPEVSEKREHYDPFLSQFEGDRSWFAWATPGGTWLNRSPSNPVTQPLGYKYEEYGVNVGIARTLGSVTLGLSVGWQDGTFNGKEVHFTSETDSFQAMLLGAWYCGNWWADGWFGYQHIDAETKHESLAWTDGSVRSGEADYTLQGWSGGFNLGYQWDFPICSISPTVGFHFGTTRNGTLWDSASLTEIAASNRGLYEVPLGVRFTRCFRTDSDWAITPTLKTEWIARFGDTGDLFKSVTYAYTGAEGDEKPDATGYYLYSAGASIPSEFHANFKLNAAHGHWLLSGSYDLSLAEAWTAHLATGTVGFTW